MASKPSKSAVDFFYKYAGYAKFPKESVEHARRRGARELAAAEAYASEHGWTYEWESDPNGVDSMGHVDPADVEEVLSVVLRDEKGRVLQSLGGVLFGWNSADNRRQGRLFEADLALEAMLGKTNKLRR